jgi:subtilisin family serine protease
MKKLLALLLSTIALYGCQKDFSEDTQSISPSTRSMADSSEYYYWCDGVKIPLTINESKLFALVETANFENASKTAVNAGSRMESYRTMTDYAPLGIESSGKNAEMRVSLTSFTLDNANLKSVDTNDLIYVAPYFKTTDGADIGITNVFSVQLTGEQDLDRLEKLAAENNFEMLGENRFDPSIYYLSCTKESKGNALEMANLMYESGAFEYATPEFLIESSGAAYTEPNDTYFRSQWNLHNRSYPGMDINYVNMMTDFSFPNIGNVIVAVVDNGIYNDHDDLPLHTVSYNAHTGGSTSGLYGDHGTMVAGIIGASTNNNQEGIAGVASGVKIMPISICYSDDGARLGISASTSTHFANAIRFAANNGAHVINNSWGFSGASPMSDINNAITYAHGKGCVVFFCSMNNNGPVSQPQAGAPSQTLVVGAIDRTGSRASYSNYGSSLDVVAPGSNIWTTTWMGGYTNSYSGTSFAAPHVSGIAALILSKNPNLTSHQVSDIIEITASNSSSWNNQTGRGLVNAHAAVSFAVNPSYVQTAIDFLIYNNTSQNLNDVHIGLSGSVGNAYVNMFSEDIYSMYRGQSAGYPNYPGTTFAGFPRATISNLNLNVFVSSASQSDLRITAQMDYGIQVSSNLYGGYGHVNLSLPNSTVPPVNGQRRRVTIYIAE